MIEAIVFGICVLAAWRLPFVFDYLILGPFLGTALGMLGWLILGLLGVDIWHLRPTGACILGGIIAVNFIIMGVRNRE